MPHANINEIALYYEDSDPQDELRLPSVVFLHGANGNAMSWWQQVPAFSMLYRCISFDCRGFFRSADATGEGACRFADDLEALIDHLSLKSVALVAQSMGGRAALAYAVRHPERVFAVVMANNWGSFDWPANWGRKQELEARGFGHIEVGRIRGLSARYQRENKELAYLFQQIAGMNPAKRPALVEPHPGSPTFLEVCALKVPMLCITGAEDLVVPAPLVRALATEVPGAQYEELPHSGHSVYYEEPARFNDLVLRFLAWVQAGTLL